MDTRYASRKFLIAVLALVSADVLLVMKLIPAEIWSTVTQVVVGLYMAGNVGDTYVTEKKE